MNKELLNRLRQQGITHIGLAWFEPESFQQVLAVMEDRDRMASTYAQWLPGALRAEKELSREGFVPVRAVLRAVDFVEHCRRHGQRIDASGRTHFASFIAAEEQRKAQRH